MEKSFNVFCTSKNELSFEFSKVFKTAPVVMCIGSPLLKEDCLGPLVGTLLKKFGYKNYVYGTLDAPITAQNFESAQKFIKSLHPSKKILMIDSSTSKKSFRLGQILLKQNYVPFNPNLKNANICADWFLFGVCSICGLLFPQMFYAKTLLVQKLAKLISKSLLKLK